MPLALSRTAIAFAGFCHYNRPRVVAANPAANDRQIYAILAIMWQRLTATRRARYALRCAGPAAP